jgi:hypothetical protein
MIEYQKVKKTETGEFLVSHSHLNLLDPDLGGHPKLFYKALVDPEEDVYKPSFEKGDLFHLWMEQQGAFVIEEQNKPTEQPAKLVEVFNRLYVQEGWKNDPIFLEMRTHNTTIGIEENVLYQELWKKVNQRPVENKEEFASFVANARYARKIAEYNKNLKETTFIEHLSNNIPYLQFLKRADGKIILTAQMKETLNNCVDAVKDHPFASKLTWGTLGNVEVEYFWTKEYDGYSLYRKGKLDKETVDEKTCTLIITDYKTTSFPVGGFADPDGSYYRYKLGRQLQNYSQAFFANHPEYYSGDWTVHLFNIVVGTIDPYPVMVYRTNSYAYKDNLMLLERRAVWHMRNNIWNMTREEAENKGQEFVEIK